MPLVKIFAKNSLSKPVPLSALQARLCQIWGTIPNTTKLMLSMVDDLPNDSYAEDCFIDIPAYDMERWNGLGKRSWMEWTRYKRHFWTKEWWPIFDWKPTMTPVTSMSHPWNPNKKSPYLASPTHDLIVPCMTTDENKILSWDSFSKKRSRKEGLPVLFSIKPVTHEHFGLIMTNDDSLVT